MQRTIKPWTLVGLGLVIGLFVFQGAQAESDSRHKVRPAKDADMVIANTFELADLDKDGRITMLEFIDHVKIFSFNRLDANLDQVISVEEWIAVESGPEGQALFARWDQNLDGRLTLEEFKQAPRGRESIVHIFRTLDLNEDGVLTLTEFTTGKE